MTCACGLGTSNETCCLPIIRGEKTAETAEALMRARYTAYVLGDIDFIVESTHPEHREGVDRENTEAWSKQSQWLGIEILAKERGEAGDEEGTVEFLAKYKLRGLTVPHRERSTFQKLDGKWTFVDGEQLAAPPTRKDGPQVGRNDPCPCGSGKKFKKCCGKAA